jgi:hypothetical protein
MAQGHGHGNNARGTPCGCSSILAVLMLALCGAQRCSSFGAGSVPPLVPIAGQARFGVEGGAHARGADRGHDALAMRSEGESNFLERVLKRRTALILPAVAIVLGEHPLRAAAEADALKKDMLKLKVGLKGLNYLLDNFDNETTQCNYAQLDRALLAQDKKSELLEAATTNALFDKDNKYMIIKCKRNPSGIKQYLGTCPKTQRPCASFYLLLLLHGIYLLLMLLSHLTSVRAQNVTCPRHRALQCMVAYELRARES